MPRRLLLIISLLLTACASTYPLYTELSPKVGPQQNLYTNSTITIATNDNRCNAAVISYRLDAGPPLEIENNITVRQLIADRMLALFQAQGLRLDEDAPHSMRIDIDELQVAVGRKGLAYAATSHTTLRLTIAGESRSMEKRYTRSADRIFPLRPEADQLSAMLNQQLEEVLATVAEDQDIRQAILAP